MQFLPAKKTKLFSPFRKRGGDRGRIAQGKAAKTAQVAIVAQLRAKFVKRTQALDEQQQMKPDKLRSAIVFQATLMRRGFHRPLLIDPVIGNDPGNHVKFGIVRFVNPNSFHDALTKNEERQKSRINDIALFST